MRSRVLMERLVWRLDGEAFVRRFRWANRVYYHWPIDVAWDPAQRNYRVHDGRDVIHTPRVRRVSRYRYGIAQRCAKIHDSYLLDRIAFRKGDLVVDCGANVGELSLHLGKQFGCELICIEPDDEECISLRENVRGLTARVVDQALWRSVGELAFYKKNDTGDSSLFEVDGYQDSAVVRTTTLDALFADQSEHRIRLLKLEAEGAEPEILQGAEQVLPLIDYIAADVGPERGLRQEVTAPAVINHLQERGFRLLDMAAKRMVCLFENSYRPPD